MNNSIVNTDEVRFIDHFVTAKTWNNHTHKISLTTAWSGQAAQAGR